MPLFPPTSETLSAAFGITAAARLGLTSSSPYTGSPTFDEVPFHLDADQRPALGTFVVIERAAGDALHYGRIITGREENPRADPALLQQNAAYQIGSRTPRPGERAPYVTRVMGIELLGEVRMTAPGCFKIEEPTHLPETGMPVHQVPEERLAWLLGLPESPADGLTLGRIATGQAAVPFILPMDALARHVAVLGKTGVGKSFAVGLVVEELERHGVPVIAFDVLGDLVNAATDLQGQTLQAGREFKVPYSIIGLSEFLSFTPNLTGPQQELVALAYDEIYRDAAQALASGTAQLPDIDQLAAAIRKIGGLFGQAPVADRAARRIEAAINRSRLLTERSESALVTVGDRPITNVFVGALTQHERNLVVGSAARVLQTFRRQGRIPPFVFVLDEAHLFLPAGGDTTPSTSVIREMVRTARHDHIGIVLISQSPASLDKQVLLTCNTRVVFALDRDDIRIVGGTMGDVPDALLNRIPKLAKGTAVVSSGADILRHSSLVAFTSKRRTREGAPTPNLAKEVRAWRDGKQH